MPLTLRVDDTPLSTCLLEQGTPAPIEILAHPMTYFMRTREEVTLICPTALVPPHIKSEGGWIGLEFIGPFDFNETGILTQVANPLAEAGISILALATFGTDYVLIKAEHRSKAIETLKKAGLVVQATP